MPLISHIYNAFLLDDHSSVYFVQIDQVIFDFRFLALLAVGGSLAGSLLCFLNVHISFNLFYFF